MTALAVGSGVITALWLLLFALLPRAMAQVPRIDPGAAATSARVSVIVPARNEEQLLGACLASLAKQDAPAHEIIVVDDHSTDGTRQMAEAAGVRVVAAGERPAGWAGKPWAAWEGARGATGDLLLFIDADTVLAPGCLRATAAALEHSGADLLSVMPRAECASFWEALFQPVMLFLMSWQLDPRRVNDPADASAAAPGSFLLFRRDAYLLIGGHEAVRAELVEDLKLAERVKSSGLRLTLAAGPEVVATRRTQRLGALWNSWIRVIVDGVHRNPALAAAGMLGVLVFFLAPYAAAPFGIVPAAIAALHLLTSRLVRGQMRRGYGIDDSLAWLQPLGALVVWLILGRALLVTLGLPLRVAWRGREYVG